MKPKTYEYLGQQLTMADIARQTGHTAARIRMRLNRGWSLDEAVSRDKMPPRISGRMGKRRSYWAKKFT